MSEPIAPRLPGACEAGHHGMCLCNDVVTTRRRSIDFTRELPAAKPWTPDAHHEQEPLTTKNRR